MNDHKILNRIKRRLLITSNKTKYDNYIKLTDNYDNLLQEISSSAQLTYYNPKDDSHKISILYIDDLYGKPNGNSGIELNSENYTKLLNEKMCFNRVHYFKIDIVTKKQSDITVPTMHSNLIESNLEKLDAPFKGSIRFC